MTPNSATPAAWLPLIREALARDGRCRFALQGTSMLPTLPVACEIEIVPPPNRVPLGSLIVFSAGDALIAHRLVGRGRGCYVTHGDGRLAGDRPVAPERLLGMVIGAYVHGRRVWPGRAEATVRWYWLARHHALSALRAAWRWWTAPG